MSARDAVPVDADVGRRIRIRRIELKISQHQLGQHLGVSFQQIQKYEKGRNRVSATRLQKIAEYFDVPVVHFFGSEAGRQEMEIYSVVDGSFGIRLMKAYGEIRDQTFRRQFVELLEAAVKAQPKRKKAPEQ